MKRTLVPIFLVILAVFQVLIPSGVGAAWNPNLIIPDSELENADSMTFSEVHGLLLRKGKLANLFHIDHRDGLMRTTAEIIYRAAREARVSPKFVLVLMQKEQSLIEDPAPSQRDLDWATGYGVCDGCRLDDPTIQRFRGFSRQTYGAALQFREGYLADLDNKGRTAAGTRVGVTMSIDGTPVTPANRATAALYAYTPHLEGNRNFATIWQRWFGRSYPDGVAVTADNKQFYLIQDGARRKFSSRAVALSRVNQKDIITATATELDKFADGPLIKFPNYSLLRAPDGGVFLLDGDARRPIVSMAVFRRLGFNPEEVEDVAADELTAYTAGDPITLETVYPLGALIQDKTTGGVYFVKNGNKYPIQSKEIMDANFKSRTLSRVSSDELDEYPTADPIKFKDGTLIGATGDPTVYIVSSGARRPIANEQTFTSFGWKWQNVIWTSPAAVNVHPLGDPLQAPSS